MEKQENELKAKIRNYGGWSINNVKHDISYLGNNDDCGVIHLLCAEELSEVELLGLIQVIKEYYDMFKGLDVKLKIFESKYYENNDTIKGKYNNFTIQTRNALSKCLDHIKNNLINAKQIISIYYSFDKRYEKSKWWKFIHKRYLNIEVE